MGKTYAINFDQPDSNVVACAAEAIAQEGVVLFPCDTAYTIGTLPQAVSHIPKGVERLFSFKKRGGAPSFPWLIESAASIDIYGDSVSDEAHKLIEGLWPGGISIVVTASSEVPRTLAHIDGTISLRMSSSPVVLALLKQLKRPMVSTGANVHGAPSPLVFTDVAQEIVDVVDIALDAGEHAGIGRPTIVDCAHGPARILRGGAVTQEEIEEVLGYRMPVV